MALHADYGTDISFIYTSDGGGGTFTAKVLVLDLTGYNRGEISTSHMGSTTFESFIPQDLEDMGQADMQIALDELIEPPMASGEKGTLEITYPIHPDHTAAAKWSGSGGFFEWSYSATPDGAMEANVSFKWDGFTKLTFSPGS